MTTSIKDLLSKRISDEPPEFQIIRDFVQEKFQEKVDLKLQNNTIVIGVKGSALAGELRLCLHELQSILNSDQVKLRIQVL